MTINRFRQQNELYYTANHYLNSETENLEMARKIANGYKTLERLFRNVPTAPQTIEVQKILGPYRREFSKLKPYVKNFLIHGSFATGDTAPGFSDLDTFVILKKETCLDVQKLSALREKVSSVKKLLLEIDPLAHHGFIFCNEQNLDYYPQHYLPVTVFRYAKSLYGPAKIQFHVRDSAEEAKENFYHYYKIFQEIAKTGVIKNKPGNELYPHTKRGSALKAPKVSNPRYGVGVYQLKWFVSMLLLMPSLYLQAKGIYLYKRFSFDYVHHPFLKKLEAARKNFSQAKKILGVDYFQEAWKMLDGWRKDLENFEKNRKFINNPKKLAMKVYERAREELADHFRKNDDAVALYEYGSVRAPGISDLDLILVTKNQLKNKFHYPSGPSINKVAKGTLMIMPESVFKYIQLFDPVNLKKIYGKEVMINRLDRKTLAHRAIASVIDWLPERLIRVIAMLHRNPLDVQYALRYLRSFAYAVENTLKLVKFSGYPEFMTQLQDLRKNWRPQKTKELMALIKRAVYLGYEALSGFTKKYAEDWRGGEGELNLFGGQKIVFTKQKERVDPDWSIANSNQQETKVFVDEKLAAHFDIYQKQPGILAKNMAGKIKIREKTQLSDSSYRVFLGKKMALATRSANFLEQNGFKFGLFRFGFYYKAK